MRKYIKVSSSSAPVKKKRRRIGEPTPNFIKLKKNPRQLANHVWNNIVRDCKRVSLNPPSFIDEITID